MESPFQQFCGLISKLNPHDDSIVLEQKLKYLASDINDLVEGDESNLEWVLRAALFVFSFLVVLS